MSSYSPNCINLRWDRGMFNFPGMVEFPVIGDGSCFFHALLRGFSKIYLTGKMPSIDNEPEYPINRSEFIMQIRNALANRLAAPVNPNDPNSPTHYQTLSRGQLESISQNQLLEKYSLPALQKELRTRSSVDSIYHEFVSNCFEKDIYILDKQKQDVYVIGNEFDLLWKGRQSVVLLYDEKNEHFNLIGVIGTNGSINTLFHPNDRFIQSLRGRLTEKIRNGSRDPLMVGRYRLR